MTHKAAPNVGEIPPPPQVAALGCHELRKTYSMLVRRTRIRFPKKIALTDIVNSSNLRSIPFGERNNSPI